MKPLHSALALMIALIWGFTFITAKIGVTHFPPIFFTFLRFGTVAVLMLPWLKIMPGRMREVLIIAFFAGALHFGLLYSGMAISPNLSSVAVLIQLGAPFSVIVAYFWLKETVGWARVAGIALSFVGVVLLGFDPAVFSEPLGALLVVAGAFSMSFAMLMMRRLRNVGVLELQAWIAAVAAPMAFTASMLFESGQFDEFSDPSWQAVGAVLYTAIATSIVGHGGWYWLLQRYKVGQVTGFGLLPPVLAVVFGVIVFDEALTWKLVVACVLVTSGLAIITLWREKQEDDKAAAPLSPLRVKEAAPAAE
ncbi:MAG: DMT family transporter [Reyranellaceae bacterium]